MHKAGLSPRQGWEEDGVGWGTWTPLVRVKRYGIIDVSE